jgi:hypothetical protein
MLSGLLVWFGMVLEMGVVHLDLDLVLALVLDGTLHKAGDRVGD